MNREVWLRERIGSDAGYLLAGRPRREPLVVAFHLALRRRLLGLAGALELLQRVLLDLAERYRETLAVDYTYWQGAQPTTLGHALLAYVYPLDRDMARLREAFARVNGSPAGAGCTNGATLPLDRERLARLLGFDHVVPHARDANWQYDLPLELTALALSVALVLDRCAEDLQIWGSREFGFVELTDRASRASLAMPQKKNPYSLTFVRGACARLIGRVAGAAALAKTATGQPDPRIFSLFEVPDSLSLAEQAAAVLADVMAGLRVDEERLADAAREGYLAANDLAEAMMQWRGIPYGTAHRIVGAAIRRALEAGEDRDGIDAARLDAAAVEITGQPLGLTDEAIREALDPRAAIARRRGLGGAAPEEVSRLLAERRAALAEQRRWIEARATALERAEAALLAQARAVGRSA